MRMHSFSKIRQSPLADADQEWSEVFDVAGPATMATKCDHSGSDLAPLSLANHHSNLMSLLNISP